MRPHYDLKLWQEIAWAVGIALLSYLLQNLEGANWTSAGAIWSSVGIGATRAAIGALLAYLGHARRHPGTDIPPTSTVLPERFAHKDHTDFRDV